MVYAKKVNFILKLNMTSLTPKHICPNKINFAFIFPKYFSCKKIQRNNKEHKC